MWGEVVIFIGTGLSSDQGTVKLYESRKVGAGLSWALSFFLFFFHWSVLDLSGHLQ